MNDIFKTLEKVNVNEHTEKKNGLTYLSWSWAWAEVMKRFPEAHYDIVTFDGKPYLYDENLGYMVMTTMVIGDIQRTMWLPVMDEKNKAMKAQPYTYKTKYGEKMVEKATMFDVNTAIMRCLVKNIAMFGLGLYIYSGEDLPAESEESEGSAKPKQKEQKPQQEEPPISDDGDKPADEAKLKTIESICKKHGFTPEAMCKSNGLTWPNITNERAACMLKTLKEKYKDE